MKAFVIKPSGEIIEAEPKNGKDFQLEEMYELVGCDTIDMVELADGRWMVVDDDGRLKKLPVNQKASELYSNGRMTVAETKAAMEEKYKGQGFEVIVMGEDSDYNIVGNALVCEKKMIK